MVATGHDAVQDSETMKSTDANLLNLLATGLVQRCDLYKFEFADAAINRLSTNDVAVRADVGDGAGNVNWVTGFQLFRGAVTQRVGLEVQTMSLRLAPQEDNGASTVIADIKNGLLEEARLTFYKGFYDPTFKLWRTVHWFGGKISVDTIGRSMVDMTIRSETERLNVAMPRNVVAPGCLHTLFDAGCALAEASFSSSGTVTATGPNNSRTFTSNSTQADAYYELGRVRFLTGANAGKVYPVRSYLNANGRFTLARPLATAPAVGDTFEKIAGCDKLETTCVLRFNNLGRFRGYPYVPVPETLYDGGASSNASTSPTAGGQGGGSSGSDLGGRFAQRGSYSNQS